MAETGRASRATDRHHLSTGCLLTVHSLLQPCSSSMQCVWHVGLGLPAGPRLCASRRRRLPVSGVVTTGEATRKSGHREKHQTSTQEARVTPEVGLLSNHGSSAGACSLTAPFPYHPEELRDGGYMLSRSGSKSLSSNPLGHLPSPDSLLLLYRPERTQDLSPHAALKTPLTQARPGHEHALRDLHCEDHSPRVPVPCIEPSLCS